MMQDMALSWHYFRKYRVRQDGATLAEVEAAAKAAKIDSYIKRLPNVYNTVLSDNGVNISKGQKQLLTIARHADRFKMLILDEATSNVDTQTGGKYRRPCNS